MAGSRRRKSRSTNASAYTSGSAYAHSRKEEGRTETGEYADFIILSNDHQGPPPSSPKRASPHVVAGRTFISCAIIRHRAKPAQPPTHHRYSEPSRPAIFACPFARAKVGCAVRNLSSPVMVHSSCHASWLSIANQASNSRCLVCK